MDVSTAFLHGEIDAEVYMDPPDGFTDNSSTPLVMKLKKGVYGLKQAGRIWNAKVNHTLLSGGFTQLITDSTIYVKGEGERKCYIVLYVDDLLIASKDIRAIEEIKRILHTEYRMKELGEVGVFIGVHIKRDLNKRKVYLSQSQYIKSMLEKFEMNECNAKDSPGQSGRTKRGSSNNRFRDRVLYQSAVGALNWIAVNTRPDIASATGVAAQHVQNPTVNDWLLVKRIMSYLKGTIGHALALGGSLIDDSLAVHVDSNWAGNAGKDMSMRSRHGCSKRRIRMSRNRDTNDIGKWNRPKGLEPTLDKGYFHSNPNRRSTASQIFPKMSKFVIFVVLMLELCHQVAPMNAGQDLIDIQAKVDALEPKVIKAVADIKKGRLLYDLSYVLYVTSDDGMAVFFDDDLPAQQPYLGNPEYTKKLVLLTYMWFCVLPPILANIYKFHDLYYPEAPLEPRTRLELLRRLHSIQAGMKAKMAKYDVHFTMQEVMAEDDGMGFINCYVDDPYERLNSDIGTAYGVLKTEAIKILLHVDRHILPVTDYEVQRILHDFGLNEDMEREIGRRSRLLKKDELDKIFEALKNAFASVPDSDTSLAYKLVKMHYDSLLSQLETFLALRRQLVTLDLTNEVETQAFRKQVLDFLRVTHHRTVITNTGELGKAIYEAVRNGSQKGYVEVGDDLLTDRPLQYMHELIHSHDRLHFYESSMCKNWTSLQ
ncbi:DNA-directed DNA polymerase [Synchytrium endobioticum]|uniref:DNA-directed DNA polymerase n=1 Tax=Synchytrium endobioticum TaxID=286115 RepID=A0A507CUA5_9FUNG|nr:DNA-directed DNA polymerase [Synchytrium endobioticum]